MYLTEYFPIIEEYDDYSKVAIYLTNINFQNEFCLSKTFLETDVIKCIASGFMPMSLKLQVPKDTPFGKPVDLNTPEVRYFLSPKLHKIRSIIPMENFVFSKSKLRESKKYEYTINKVFNQVLDKCVETHGSDWLTPPLVKLIKNIYSSNLYFSSFEVWDNNNLVAGEIGYYYNKIYTSLTGFHTISGSGGAQLMVLGQHLIEKNIKIWDLGMPMNYKTALGAINIPRKEFLFNYLYDTLLQ